PRRPSADEPDRSGAGILSYNLDQGPRTFAACDDRGDLTSTGRCNMIALGGSKLRRRSWRRGMFVATMLAGLTAPAMVMADTPTLRVAIAEDALTLDPIASSDNPSIWTELLIYDQLVRPSADGTKLEPDLAESWTVAPDGLEYTFTLRDAKFANGDPVTAD